MSIQSKLAHYYRFALIGATSSGKTCLLVKLASGRDSNRTRFTSQSIPLGDFMPTETEGDDDPSQWSEDRKLQENFRIGEERLEAAKEKFQANQRPEATSNDASRPMMRFKLSDADQRGEFSIWTEDYAGEFLNKEGLTDPTSLSSRLKSNLLKYDGLLIVVEAASTLDELLRVQNQIETLSAFFSALTEEEKREGRTNNIPVAVLITKWDRVSQEIDFRNPSFERTLLEKYFGENPMYEKIVTTVKAYAKDLQVKESADCPTAIVCGNTAVFPVSAFGKSRHDENGNDFPLESESFCLVEPFYWLASKCDEIRVTELEESVNSKKFWWPVGFKNISQKIKVLKPLLEQSNRCFDRFKKASSSFILKEILCWVFWLTFLFVSAYSGTVYFYHHQFHTWETAMKQTENTTQDYSTLKAKFVHYKKSGPVNWLFFPGNKRTDADIQFIEKAVDKQAWLLTGEPAKDAEMAKAYIGAFPNGAHTEEAHKLIQSYEIHNEQTAWEAVEAYPELRDKAVAAESYLKEFDTDGKAKYRHKALQIIAQNVIQIEEDAWLPVTQAKAESDEQKNLAESYLARFNADGKNARHYTEARNLIAAAESRAAWERDLSTYNRECTGKDCAKIIAAMGDLISRHEDRCKPLIEALPNLIEEKLNENVRSSEISSMLSEYEKVTTAVTALERQLRDRNESSLAASMMTVIQRIHAMKATSIEKFDENLYLSVKSSRTVVKCQEYLNKMENYGGGAMRSEVEEYKAFLEKKDSRYESVSISASVRWTHEAHHSIHHESFKINGIVYKDQRCDPPKGGQEVSLGIYTFTQKSLSDTFLVDAYFVTEGNYYNWNNVVWLTVDNRPYKLGDLISGKEIDITVDGKKFGTISIKATVPNLYEPELPSWHK